MYLFKCLNWGFFAIRSLKVPEEIAAGPPAISPPWEAAPFGPWRKVFIELWAVGYSTKAICHLINNWCRQLEAAGVPQVQWVSTVSTYFAARLWAIASIPAATVFWVATIVIVGVGLTIFLIHEALKDEDRTVPGADNQYIVTMGETVYFAELIRKRRDGTGIYHLLFELDPNLVLHRGGIPVPDGTVDHFFWGGETLMAGRRVIRYWRWVLKCCETEQCGMLEIIGPDLYILRDGGWDRYADRKPAGIITPPWPWPGYSGWLREKPWDLLVREI